MKRLFIMIMLAVFSLQMSAQTSGGMIKRGAIQKKSIGTVNKKSPHRRKTTTTQKKRVDTVTNEVDSAIDYIVDWMDYMNEDLPDYIDDEETVYAYEITYKELYLIFRYKVEAVDVANLDAYIVKREVKKTIRESEDADFIKKLKIVGLGLKYIYEDTKGHILNFTIESDEL